MRQSAGVMDLPPLSEDPCEGESLLTSVPLFGRTSLTGSPSSQFTKSGNHFQWGDEEIRRSSQFGPSEKRTPSIHLQYSGDDLRRMSGLPVLSLDCPDDEL